MKEIGKFCVNRLRAAGWTGDLRPHLTINLAEEFGEFAGAARRYLGMGRRTGGIDAVRLELADVVITAYSAAEVFGFDLDEAISEKFKVLAERPWRDERPEGDS